MDTISVANERDATTIVPGVTRLAEGLLAAARATETVAERREAAQMARLMRDPKGKAFLFALVDEVFRSRRPATQARRWRALIAEFGLPHYPGLRDRLLMAVGAAAGTFAPGLVMPLVSARLRAEAARVILDADAATVRAYLRRRREQGFRVNLNHLGEAVLGEAEAAHRLKIVLDHLQDPEVDYISIKISAIYSQINLLAWEQTREAIEERLSRILEVALPSKKFVNLDMEEYRDLALTIQAFERVLDRPEFLQLSAGIVLQAYLPDSWVAQQSLVEWSRLRVERGGAPIKIRIVKGANLAMETVEAQLHGWQRAPYATKAETDANYCRMVEWGCRPENTAVARLGVASHNLLDVALALVLRDKNGVAEQVEIEMLEGMANQQARAVRDAANGLLLYAPVVDRDEFIGALAYLIRRLDENTTPQNYLHDLFALAPGTPAWEEQCQAFAAAWEMRHAVGTTPRRAEPVVAPAGAPQFVNEPDADWTQAATRDALWAALRGWKPVPLPPLPAHDRLLETARSGQAAWAEMGVARRAAILRRAAQVMAQGRNGAIACMVQTAKKAIGEADVEVSEAIDYARFYAGLEFPSGIRANPLGTVVVTPPWNFPYAIPCGGTLAALLAGNCVILKPAPETVDTAWLLARQLWEAGVPRDALQFYACDDGDAGRALICDPRVHGVILTGSLETARMFQEWRPSLPLLAETSGKNAMTITAQADRELAIKDLAKSAFGHAGQKCSAASLAMVQAEVYDSPDFRRQLRDAVASLPVGASTDPRSVVTPLIRQPGEALLRALTTLDAGEEWLLEPRLLGDDPCAWSPGIKLGVRPGSWFHQTECFGPVLGLMRCNDLEEALAWANGNAFGLTAGLHSLDPEEIAKWSAAMRAGNLYINRGTTGAIVGRQPFGGWKASSIGPGAKAGGPNYPLNFCRLDDADCVADEWEVTSYMRAWQQHFSQPHDPCGLEAESNVFRYLPCRGVVLRLEARDEVALRRARLAAHLTGAPLTVSLACDEPDAEFIARLPQLAQKAEFLRTLSTPDDAVLRAAYAVGLNWINAPITFSGRMELRFWLREQAVSRTRHRYGHLR